MQQLVFALAHMLFGTVHLNPTREPHVPILRGFYMLNTFTTSKIERAVAAIWITTLARFGKLEIALRYVRGSVPEMPCYKSAAFF